MTTRKAIADALDTRVEHATLGLNITCIKAFPGWDRGDLSLPIATILWEADEVTTRSRTGQRMSPMQETVFTLTIMAANEISLWSLVDAAFTMVENWQSPTIGGVRMSIAASRAERTLPPDDGTEDLRYSAQMSISFLYAR